MGGSLNHCPLVEASKKVLADLVEDLVQQAFRVSQDQRASTPFSEEYSEILGESYRGGKPDDMAVIAALVVCDKGDNDGKK